jgi:hypothetical protein
MTAAELDEVYEQHIKPLPRAERLRLLALIARELAGEAAGSAEQPTRDIMELHGLGKEIWDGVDAQDYVDRLRDEWGERAS